MAMTLRLTDEQDAKLTQIADKRQISKQRAIEVLIEEANEREFVNVRLQEAYEFVMSHDKELMERLADA